MKLTNLIIFITILASIFVVGCSDENPSSIQKQVDEKKVSAEVDIEFDQIIDFDYNAKVLIYDRDSDTLVEELNVTDSSLSGTIAEIKVEKGKFIEILLIDKYSNLIYQGLTLVNKDEVDSIIYIHSNLYLVEKNDKMNTVDGIIIDKNSNNIISEKEIKQLVINELEYVELEYVGIKDIYNIDDFLTKELYVKQWLESEYFKILEIVNQYINFLIDNYEISDKDSIYDGIIIEDKDSIYDGIIIEDKDSIYDGVIIEDKDSIYDGVIIEEKDSIYDGIIIEEKDSIYDGVIIEEKDSIYDGIIIEDKDSTYDGIIIEENKVIYYYDEYQNIGLNVVFNDPLPLYKQEAILSVFDGIYDPALMNPGVNTIKIFKPEFIYNKLRTIKSMELIIDYAEYQVEGINEDELQVYEYSLEKNEWRKLERIIDKENNRIIAIVLNPNLLGEYGLVYEPGSSK